MAANLQAWFMARFASNSAATAAPPITCTFIPMASNGANNSANGT